MPSPNQLAGAQASIIYYDDGKTELARISDVNGNRESVDLADISVQLQKAVLAAEDRSFYTNAGVSPTGIARAVWEGLRGSDAQGGGSTITQQYVKNFYLTQDKSLVRKAREIIISVKIDQQHSKDEILQDYLNTIYYGRGAYGVKTAARAYFGKDPSQPTLPESAVLASVINAPSLYDPALGPKQQANLKNRVGYVLDGMVAEGWLAPGERALIPEVPPTIAPQPNRALAGPNGYLVAEVRKELASDLKLTDNDIDRGGLRITTTVSKKAQDAALAAIQKDVPKDAKDVYAGLAAVRPGDGGIVAMYGGADYQARQFNAATDAVMQAGSTFKPFALVAALRQGISTKTRFDGNSPLEVPGLGRTGGITNEGNTDFGMVDLRRATAKSVNTVFVGLNLKIGPKATHDAAVAAGIPADTPGLGEDLTNVLGTSSPHVLDVANAYATIAAQGQRATPYLIAAVTSEQVDIDYKAPKQVAEAFSKDVAADVLDAMRQVTAPGGTGSRAGDIGRPVARQDRHLRGAQVRVVHGGHPPAVGLGRDVPGRRRSAPAAREHRGHRRAERQLDPSVDLEGLRHGGAAGRADRRLPEAGRHRRQQGLRAAAGDDHHPGHHDGCAARHHCVAQHVDGPVDGPVDAWAADADRAPDDNHAAAEAHQDHVDGTSDAATRERLSRAAAPPAAASSPAPVVG